MFTLAKNGLFNYNRCGDTMLKRKINRDLITWHDNPSRLALLIKGPRGAGKTTLIERFAKENYKYVVKLDFEKNPELIPFFNENFKQIYVNEQRVIELVPINGSLTILFGDEVDAEEKFFKIKEIYTNVLPYSADKKYSLIDVRFKNRVIAKKANI